MLAAGGRSFLIAFVVASAALVLLSGCGGDGGGGDETIGSTTTAVSEENAVDIEVMNVALTQELTLLQVYRHGLPLLSGESRAIARQFLAQEQEHINGITKALRGLQGDAEGEVEEVDYSEVKTEEDALLQIYEITGLQLKHYLDDVAHLETIAPRALVATMAANEAQHLVILRQLLGTDRAESVPEGFDAGEIPPPVEKSASDRG